MPNTDFIPKTEEAKAALFERFRDTIPTYAAVLGLDPDEVTDQAADATWFRYILNHTLVVRDSGVQWTNFKNALLNGPGDGTIPATPTTPAAPTPAPADMPLGVLPRFRELCRRIKANAAYTEAMGEALGIVGPDSSPHNLSTLAHEISLRTSG